jgi:hypothetical protein
MMSSTMSSAPIRYAMTSGGHRAILRLSGLWAASLAMIPQPASAADAGDALGFLDAFGFLIVVLIVAGLIYFLPTIIAVRSEAPNQTAVLFLNLFGAGR